MDRENVIRGLESQLDDLQKYADADEMLTLTQEQVKEILVLLKEQEAVIRCKDCKHRDPEDHKCDCGHDIQWQLPREDDWFCADGERKKGR